MRHVISLVLLGICLCSVKSKWSGNGYDFPDCPMRTSDIFISIDNSKLVSRKKFGQLKCHAKKFISLMKTGIINGFINVDVHSFASDVYSDKFTLGEKKTVKCIKKAIQSLEYHGDEAAKFSASYVYMKNELRKLGRVKDRKNYQPYHIMFTAGTSNGDNYEERTGGSSTLMSHYGVLFGYGTFGEKTSSIRGKGFPLSETEDLKHHVETRLMLQCLPCYKPSVDIVILWTNVVSMKTSQEKARKMIIRLIDDLDFGIGFSQSRIAIITYGATVVSERTKSFITFRTASEWKEEINKWTFDKTSTKKDIGKAINHFFEYDYQHVRTDAKKLFLSLTNRDKPYYHGELRSGEKAKEEVRKKSFSFVEHNVERGGSIVHNVCITVSRSEVK